jgi:hypothetical protein
MSSYNRTNNNNSQRYIPRDDRRDTSDTRDTRDDRRRDAYYEAFEGVYGGDVARAMYGESKVPITHPSICIPRTFTTIRGEQTKRSVFNTFRDLRIGHIERIDTVHKTDQRGERFCTVYVHLTWNVTSKLARDTRQKLLEGQDVKIVYDEPWFWKCTMSTMEKPESRFPEKQERTTSRPRIDLGDGTKAVSRYTRDDQQDKEREHQHQRQREHEQGEQPNRDQLCNMGSEGEGEGEDEE